MAARLLNSNHQSQSMDGLMLHVHRANGERSLADLLRGLGGISPTRVRIDPPPGAATLRDIARVLRGGKAFVELLDGTLIDKPLSFPHSVVAAAVSFAVGRWCDSQVADPGYLAGPGGPVRLSPHVVLMPTAPYTRREKLPSGLSFRTPYLPLAPDLVAEVLQPGNTRGEMKRKLKEYFLAGVDLVWFVDPEKRTVRVFTSPDESETLTEKGTLTGGAVLPGFAVPVADLFASLPPKPKKPAAKSKKRK